MKILLYDIESFPNLAWIWNRYEQNAIGDMERTKHIASFAWKWLGEKNTHWLGLPSFKRYRTNPDDTKPLTLALLNVINEADIAIGHNIDSFDDRMANTEFWKHDVVPKPHKSIDTLKIVKKFFKLDSYKLDDVCHFLGIGRKLKHAGFGMWRGCINGDSSSWKEMEMYNRHDVDPLLEGLFLREREWILAHQIEWKKKKLTREELGYGA